MAEPITLVVNVIMRPNATATTFATQNYEHKGTKIMPNETPAINPDLIRKYAAGATEEGIKNLITLFDFQRRQMQRAEDLCRTAWNHARQTEAKAEVKAPIPANRPKTQVEPKPKDNSPLKLDI